MKNLIKFLFLTLLIVLGHNLYATEVNEKKDNPGNGESTSTFKMRLPPRPPAVIPKPSTPFDQTGENSRTGQNFTKTSPGPRAQPTVPLHTVGPKGASASTKTTTTTPSLPRPEGNGRTDHSSPRRDIYRPHENETSTKSPANERREDHRSDRRSDHRSDHRSPSHTVNNHSTGNSHNNSPHKAQENNVGEKKEKTPRTERRESITSEDSSVRNLEKLLAKYLIEKEELWKDLDEARQELTKTKEEKNKKTRELETATKFIMECQKEKAAFEETKKELEDQIKSQQVLLEERFTFIETLTRENTELNQENNLLIEGVDTVGKLVDSIKKRKRERESSQLPRQSLESEGQPKRPRTTLNLTIPAPEAVENPVDNAAPSGENIVEKLLNKDVIVASIVSADNAPQEGQQANNTTTSPKVTPSKKRKRSSGARPSPKKNESANTNQEQLDEEGGAHKRRKKKGMSEDSVPSDDEKDDDFDDGESKSEDRKTSTRTKEKFDKEIDLREDKNLLEFLNSLDNAKSLKVTHFSYKGEKSKKVDNFPLGLEDEQKYQVMDSVTYLSLRGKFKGISNFLNSTNFPSLQKLWFQQTGGFAVLSGEKWTQFENLTDIKITNLFIAGKSEVWSQFLDKLTKHLPGNLERFNVEFTKKSKEIFNAESVDFSQNPADNMFVNWCIIVKDKFKNLESFSVDGVDILAKLPQAEEKSEQNSSKS